MLTDLIEMNKIVKFQFGGSCVRWDGVVIPGSKGHKISLIADGRRCDGSWGSLVWRLRR